MQIDRNDIDYLNKIMTKIERGESIRRRTDHDNAEIEAMQLDECSECGEIIDYWDLTHIMMGELNSPIIAICCEGYHPLDAS